MSLNSTVNDTRPVVIIPDIPPITMQLTIYLMTVFICLVGLVGNGIIIHLFSFRINLNQSTVYILNLAVADFIFVFGCCMVSLYFLWEYNNRVHTLSESHTIFTRFGDVLHSFGFNSSLFFLATLSIEQCFSIRFPMWYKCHRPEHLSAILCGILWIVTVLITVLERFLSHEYRSTVYIAISIIFLVVTLAMVGAGAFLIIELQKTSMQFRPLKLYIIVITAVITFLISLVPITTVRFLFSFALLPTEMRLLSIGIVFLCSAINSTVNPYIYIIMGKWKKSISNTKALESVFKEEGGRSSEGSHSAETQQTDLEHQSGILRRN